MSFSFIYVHYINIIKYYKNMLTLEKRNVIIKTVKEIKQTEVRTMEEKTYIYIQMIYGKFKAHKIKKK